MLRHESYLLYIYIRYIPCTVNDVPPMVSCRPCIALEIMTSCLPVGTSDVGIVCGNVPVEGREITIKWKSKAEYNFTHKVLQGKSPKNRRDLHCQADHRYLHTILLQRFQSHDCYTQSNLYGDLTIRVSYSTSKHVNN